MSFVTVGLCYFPIKPTETQKKYVYITQTIVSMMESPINRSSSMFMVSLGGTETHIKIVSQASQLWSSLGKNST